MYVGGQQPNQVTSSGSNILHAEIHVMPSVADRGHQPPHERHNVMRVDELHSFDHNTIVRL